MATKGDARMGRRASDPNLSTKGIKEGSSSAAEKSGRLTVGVRVRPLGDAERKRGEEGAWEVDCETNTLRPLVSVEKSNASYTLDQVFDGESDTVSVYKALAAPVVQDVLEGYNGTVFAYGQTSSGKTHTLLGTLEQPGIILQSMQELLMTMATRSTWNDYMMSVSYVEVYNETLVDLLATKQEVTRGSKVARASFGGGKLRDGEAPAKFALNSPQKEKGLRIFEDATYGPFVQGLTKVPIASPDQVVDLLFSGESKRSYAGTEMNARSSRSHTVFQIVVESRPVEKEGETGDEDDRVVRRSALNLVDLAGSERVAKTEATGARLKESGNINKSLMALTMVIYKLSAGDGDDRHINFRDSKLTRLLSNSLGGNARTSAITCLCPSVRHAYESVGTLQFALRAKRVVNKAQVNTVSLENSMLNGSADAEAFKNSLRMAVDSAKSDTKTIDPELLAALESIKASGLGGEGMDGEALLMNLKMHQEATRQAEAKLHHLQELASFTAELTSKDLGKDVARRTTLILQEATRGAKDPLSVLDDIEALYGAEQVGGARALSEDEQERLAALRELFASGGTGGAGDSTSTSLFNSPCKTPPRRASGRRMSSTRRRSQGTMAVGPLGTSDSGKPRSASDILAQLKATQRPQNSNSFFALCSGDGDRAPREGGQASSSAKDDDDGVCTLS